MADFKNYITPRGLKRLVDEQKYLRLVDRPQVVEVVHWAASLGDRSENADYQYGKRRLRQIDRRLHWLDKRIIAAELMDPAVDRGDRVYFGATVTLGYNDPKEITVMLVGEDEIDSKENEISWRSPLGRVLMRRAEGDVVFLNHLGVSTEIEIVEVQYLALQPDPPSEWDKAQAAGVRAITKM